VWCLEFCSPESGLQILTFISSGACEVVLISRQFIETLPEMDRISFALPPLVPTVVPCNNVLVYRDLSLFLARS
jgi:hypothetical protein